VSRSGKVRLCDLFRGELEITGSRFVVSGKGPWAEN
jgi:hypothetical protein